ncbi:hypothetical protein LCGC14_1711570, partial [marine sediment metagenome]
TAASLSLFKNKLSIRFSRKIHQGQRMIWDFIGSWSIHPDQPCIFKRSVRAELDKVLSLISQYRFAVELRFLEY